MIGTTVSNFEIVRRLGRGGMGAVYAAKDQMLDRPVAIKVVHPELGREPELKARFQKEARALAKLHHPNVTSVFSLFAEGDKLYLVMELVEGRSLQEHLQEHGALDWREATRLAIAALEGLNHAHQHGIVHRDIKPSNLMLPAEGGLKLMDFGIAHILGQNRLTRHGSVVGTLAYMAPEQITSRQVDPRTDLYSLGIVLYEMVTGRTPFRSDSEYELMRAQVEKVPAPPRTLAADVPPWLEQTILRTLSKNPGDRAASARDLSTELRRGFGADETLDAQPTKVLVGRSGSADTAQPVSGLPPTLDLDNATQSPAETGAEPTGTIPVATEPTPGIATPPIPPPPSSRATPSPAPKRSAAPWILAIVLVLGLAVVAGVLLLPGVLSFLTEGGSEPVASTDASGTTTPPATGAGPPPAVPPVGDSNPSFGVDDASSKPSLPPTEVPLGETPDSADPADDGSAPGVGAVVGDDPSSTDGPGATDPEPPVTPPPPTLDPDQRLIAAGEIAHRLCPDIDAFYSLLSDRLDEVEDRGGELNDADLKIEEEVDELLDAAETLRRAYNVVATREGWIDRRGVLGQFRRLGSATREVAWQRARQTTREGRDVHRTLAQASAPDANLRNRWASLQTDLQRLERLLP